MSVKRKGGSNEEDAETKKTRTDSPEVGTSTHLKLLSLLTREIQNEINYRKKDLDTIEERILHTRQSLNKIRQAVVSDYYRQQNKNSTQQPLHPAVKKVVGKRPKNNKADGESVGEPSFYQCALSPVTIKEEPISSDEDNSLQEVSPQNPSPQASGSKLITQVPRYIPPKMPDRDIKQTIGPRNPTEKQKLRLIVGNTSKWIGSNSTEATHKWTVYIRSPDTSLDIPSVVTKVKFVLHPSYKPNDVIVVENVPFRLTRLGWGEFPLRVQFHFADPSDKPVEVIHNLKLDHTHSGIDVFGQETVCDFMVHFGNSYAMDNHDQLPTDNVAIENTFDEKPIIVDNTVAVNEEIPVDLISEIKVEPIDECEINESYGSASNLSEGDLKLEPVPLENVEVSVLDDGFVYPDTCSDNIICLDEIEACSKSIVQNEVPSDEPHMTSDVDFIDSTTFVDGVCVMADETQPVESDSKESLYSAPVLSGDFNFDNMDADTLATSNLTQLLDSMFPQYVESTESEPIEVIDLSSEPLGSKELTDTPRTNTEEILVPEIGVGEVKIVAHGKTLSHKPISLMVMRKPRTNSSSVASMETPNTSSSNSLSASTAPFLRNPNSEIVSQHTLTISESVDTYSLPSSSTSKGPQKIILADNISSLSLKPVTPMWNNASTSLKGKSDQKNLVYKPVFFTNDGNLIRTIPSVVTNNILPQGQISGGKNGQVICVTGASLVMSPAPSNIKLGHSSKAGKNSLMETGANLLFQAPNSKPIIIHKKVVPGVSLLKKSDKKPVTALPRTSKSSRASQETRANPSQVSKLTRRRSELLKECPVQKVEYAVCWLLKHCPVVDRRASSEVFRVLYPYCTTDSDTFLSWPLPKQRAAELTRANDVLRLLKTLFPSEPLWTPHHIWKYSRIRGFTPMVPTDNKPSSEHELYFPLTSAPDIEFENKETELEDEVIDVVGIDEDSPPLPPSDEEHKPSPEVKELLLLDPHESSLSDYIEKNCEIMHIWNLEIEELAPGIWFPGVHKMLVSCFMSLAEDLIRRSYAEAWKRYRDKPPPEVNVTDVLAAIMSREEFDLFTDEGLGQRVKQEEVNQGASTSQETEFEGS